MEPPTKIQTQIKLEECIISKEDEAENGDVSFNKIADKL